MAPSRPSDASTVRLTSVGAATTLELHRPESLNAWNSQLASELRDALERVGADPAVRAVVIRGAGRAFSAGADLHELAAATEPIDVGAILRVQYNPIIRAVREMPKPVIAALTGPAVGIGCSLALACDLVLAAQSAYLQLGFVNIGLIPDGGASYFLPARAGFARARELALLGEPLSAARALEWGLVNAVHADAELDGAVAALAGRLAGGPTLAYAAIKRALNGASEHDLEAAFALEGELQQAMAATADFREGVAAFAQRRPARYAGS
jgi:2-(1,2-epoxy-1,2-dihydrophenyl)acetyl-CoA isomerase